MRIYMYPPPVKLLYDMSMCVATAREPRVNASSEPPSWLWLKSSETRVFWRDSRASGMGPLSSLLLKLLAGARVIAKVN